MTDWKVAEGTGWIGIEGFGQINPRRDNVDGGRTYFTAKTAVGGFAQVRGPEITHGPETWYYELDQPFFLRDENGTVLEVVISLLPAGKYAVKSRPGVWPEPVEHGGWSSS